MGVLSQAQDRQEIFLECWGRKRNKYEWKYLSYKVELLAVIQCIKKWKHILCYQHFEVYTDASALKYLTTMKNNSGLFTRWFQMLAGFNFMVVHKKGKENSNADTLSRSSHMVEAPLLAEEKYAEFYKIDEPVIQFEDGVNEIQHIQRSMVEIAAEQVKDEVWSEVISWMKQGRLPEKTETRGKAREVLVALSMFDPEVFKMKDGVLMFTKAANQNWIGEVCRIFFPESMLTEVWSLCHQSDLGGQRCLEGTLNKYLKGFFL